MNRPWMAGCLVGLLHYLVDVARHSQAAPYQCQPKASTQGLREQARIKGRLKNNFGFWWAAATAAGVRLHRRISNMPVSPSYAALSSPRQNLQFIYEPTLRLGKFSKERRHTEGKAGYRAGKSGGKSGRDHHYAFLDEECKKKILRLNC